VCERRRVQTCRGYFADLSLSLLFRSFSRTTHLAAINDQSFAAYLSVVHSQSKKPCLYESVKVLSLQTEALAPHPSIISNFADFALPILQSFFPPKHLLKHDLFLNKTKKKNLIRVFF
jgi:hypothetical protein